MSRVPAASQYNNYIGICGDTYLNLNNKDFIFGKIVLKLLLQYYNHDNIGFLFANPHLLHIHSVESW